MRRTRTRIALLSLALCVASGGAAAAGQPGDRIEWLCVSGGVGYKRLLLRTFVADEDTLTADIVPAELDGPAPSLALGVKLWFVTLGVSATVAELSGTSGDAREATELRLWSVAGEIGFRAPLGAVEPFVMVGGGYSTFGDSARVIDGLSRGLDIDGVHARAGLGVDWYVTPALSLRVAGTGEVLFLSREGVPVRDLAEPKEVGTLDEAQARILEADGASAGLALELGAALSVHF